MENKKIKLTISGKPKKSLKNFETKNQRKKSVFIIEKSQNKFVKKGSSFRPNKPIFNKKTNQIQMILKKENLQNKELQKD